jgi:hypothetical protein
MTTSPSRNGLVTIFVHPHNADVPVKAVKIPTASTAVTITGRKPCKTAHFQTIDQRAVFVVAVDHSH